MILILYLSLLLLLGCSVMSNSLWPYGLQHTSFSCPSLSPGVCSSSSPLSRWCHPTISSSVILFFSCPQSFPASKSSKELPLEIWWPNYWSLISLKSKGLFKSPHKHHSSKASILQCSAFFMAQLSHLNMTSLTIIDLTIQTFVGKMMSQLFNMLSRFVIAFLPRSKYHGYL